MKAIILAAGKGTRLQPLTLEIPKAMVEVYGKPLLAHNLDKLSEYVDEFVIVVKYKAEIIENYFKNEYKGIPIRYHVQGDKQGTAGALDGINIEGDIFVIASDTIFHQSDIDKIALFPGYAALCKEVDTPEKYGIFKCDSKNSILEVVEKPKKYIGKLASLFYFKVNQELIKAAESVKESSRGEYELTDALNIFIKNNRVNAFQIEKDFIDITSLEDLSKAHNLSKPELGTLKYIENIGEYELYLGIPKKGVQEIINYTLDDTDIALRNGTGDWKKRFINKKNFKDWYSDDNRYPFTLLDKKGVVQGLWWGRPALAPNIENFCSLESEKLFENNKNHIHTSGIRVYPQARGKGIASKLLELTARCYGELYPNFCMSVDIDEENIASQKSYEKQGYIKIGIGKNINNSPEGETKRFVYFKKN